MSPKIMRVCTLLVAFFVIQIQGNDLEPRTPAKANAMYGKFWNTTNNIQGTGDETPMNSKPFLMLMKDHFDLSMKYLLTSKQYGGQYAQRPGMAKFLDEASDRHWEEGMDHLKKFLQRGGLTNDVHFNSAFTIQGNIADLAITSSGVSSDKYIGTLESMLGDSKKITKSMNHLHHLASKIFNRGGDFEIAHYFDSKLKKEAEITRDLAGYINILDKMKNSGIAVNMFDSNL